MYEYRVKKVLKVVDGDTIDVDIDLGFDISFTSRVRLAGIDTPDPDILKLKEYLPLFEAQANLPDAPQTFKQFVSWMRTQ